MTLGNLIKHARKEAKLTQRQLATHLGMRTDTLGRIESGKTSLGKKSSTISKRSRLLESYIGLNKTVVIKAHKDFNDFKDQPQITYSDRKRMCRSCGKVNEAERYYHCKTCVPELGKSVEECFIYM